jgi:FtsH ternary system domain X6
LEARLPVTPTVQLTRFEANLVRILRFFLRTISSGDALPLLFTRCTRPACLSRACVHIIQDTLAKGCVRLLAQGGGWKRERFLRGNGIADGRLWQRSLPRDLGLRFSRNTLDLLLWFTAENAGDGKSRRRKPPPESMTVGDALVCYYAYTALRETQAGPALTNRLGFGSQALCWLAFPQDFTRRSGDEKPDFSLWTAGIGACVLEALQTELTQHLLAAEQSKQQLADAAGMQALGTSQERILAALGRAGRHDLARFLLAGLAELLPPSATAAAWIGNLRDAGTRLADRAVIYRKALAVIHRLERFQQWEEQARGVGYFDENYAAAQLWKADWETWQGEALCRRAETVFRELDVFAPSATR